MVSEVPCRTDDDCLAAALASLTGLPYESFPLLRTVNTPPAGRWLTILNAWLEDGGINLRLMCTADGWPPHPQCRIAQWIAFVPSRNPGHELHAVVMEGDRLLWDPAVRNRYESVAPADVRHAFVVVVAGPPRDPTNPRQDGDRTSSVRLVS